ncbi:MAG: RsmB/NOP family class I SAM-dependent RNA methyltransferase [Clostridiales bacterium]|nr:RsmB/NOP family class I SAM-dependent RNA methyltransferase [Clostridiales bacterium]
MPAKFIERMKAELGDSFPGFMACYEEPPKRGLRVNTLKISPEEFVNISPWPLEETGVLGEGFILKAAANVGSHPYHAAGLFYMQEPSAMSAVRESGVDDSGMRVLDMCAAPGGKSGGVAARMKGRGLLVSNEIVPKRAWPLTYNIERLGVTNAAVISAKPEDVARELPEFFDVVLVDAPCSGEGMFRKDETAVAEWSPEHVSACAERQSLILESAQKCVAEGGALVYSTCTFSHEENEGVIEKFIESHGDYTVEHMERLYPHTSVGEGHFVCRLRRGGEKPRIAEYRRIAPERDKKTLALLSDLVESLLGGPLPDGTVFRSWDRLRLVPEDMPEAVMRLHPFSVGTEIASLRKNRLEPEHSLFMAAMGQKYRRELVLSPDDPMLTAFMAGNTVPCPEGWRGWSAVSVRAGGGSFPIGYGKAVDGVMKNHLPKGLYIN